MYVHIVNARHIPNVHCSTLGNTAVGALTGFTEHITTSKQLWYGVIFTASVVNVKMFLESTLHYSFAI